MFDVKSIKNCFNPLNAVVVGIIALFICIRIFSNNQENAFIIESMNPSETSETSDISVTSETLSNQTSESVDQSQTNSQTQTAEQINDRPSSATEPLAYSAELGKTFNLDAFNQLSKDELMTFSGIGEVTAQAIMDYRKENGPFSDFNELLLVKGIGEKKLQKIMTILP